MQLFGIELQKPTFRRLTTCAVYGLIVVILAAVANRTFNLNIPSAATFSYFWAIFWGTASGEFGVRINGGRRHRAVYLSILMLGIFTVAGASVALGLI